MCRKSAAAVLITSAIAAIVAPCATAGAAPLGPAGTAGSACVPTVEGPIATTDTSKPYTAVLQYDLPPGWVDEEYFVSCSSPAITYKTAVIVRKPETPRKASGIVAVDPLHSAGLWGLMTLLQPYFVENGDVHIGVVASNSPLETFVKPSDRARYASLSIPSMPDAPNEVLAGVGALLHQRPKALLGDIKFKDAVLGGLVPDRGCHPHVHQLAARQGHRRRQAAVRRLLPWPGGRRIFGRSTGPGDPGHEGACGRAAGRA